MVKRYNNDRQCKEEIAVRYMFAPKEKVMHDIVNLSQNLTLPVVSIDVTSVQRDPQRVFNKVNSFYVNDSLYNTPDSIQQFRTPTPIRINLNMSILAVFQVDLEQIASNFMAYFNPYIILATKVPVDLGPKYDLEVRTKAQWSGSLSITTPTELTYTDKLRRVGDTSFVLDAWIYPEEEEDIEPIYFVDANFYSVIEKTLNESSYYSLSGQDYSLSSYPGSVQGVETISLSGTPTITNIFFSTSGKNLPLDANVVVQGTNSRRFLLYGYNFDSVDYVLLSAADTSLYRPLTSLNSTYYGPVSGAILDNYTVLNDNMMEVEVPYHSEAGGEFTIVLYNRAGWSTTQYASNNTLIWSGLYYAYVQFEDGTIILTEDGSVLIYEYGA